MTTCIIIPWFNHWRTKNEEEFKSLKTKLKKEGHKAHILDYDERPNDITQILKKLDKLIKKTKDKKITLIGFSLGAFIAVKYVTARSESEDASTRVHRTSSKDISGSTSKAAQSKSSNTHEVSKVNQAILCVPLIQGSKVFRAMYTLWPFWKKSSGSLLYDASYEKLSTKDIPKDVDIGIISGTKRMNWTRHISYFSQAVHLNDNNDGLFSGQEGKFGDYEQIKIPINHYDASHDPKIQKPILNFIKNSKFN